MPAATASLLDDAAVDVEQWISAEVESAFAEQEAPCGCARASASSRFSHCKTRMRVAASLFIACVRKEDEDQHGDNHFGPDSDTSGKDAGRSAEVASPSETYPFAQRRDEVGADADFEFGVAMISSVTGGGRYARLNYMPKLIE